MRLAPIIGRPPNDTSVETDSFDEAKTQLPPSLFHSDLLLHVTTQLKGSTGLG